MRPMEALQEVELVVEQAPETEVLQDLPTTSSTTTTSTTTTPSLVQPMFPMVWVLLRFRVAVEVLGLVGHKELPAL